MKHIRDFASLQAAKDATLFSPVLINVSDGGGQKLLIMQDGNKELKIKDSVQTLDDLKPENVEEKQTPSEGPEMVDLGLSVKWAKYDLGATCEGEHGKYYAWGDTTGYIKTTTLNSGFVRNSSLDTEDKYYWTKDGRNVYTTTLDLEINMGVREITKGEGWDCDGTAGQLTGFTVNSIDFVNYSINCQFDDEWYATIPAFQLRTKLTGNNDMATRELGSLYRMPTVDELRELINGTTQTINNNIVKFQSKVNSNYILIPIAGYGISNQILEVNVMNMIWSSECTNEYFTEFLSCDSSGEAQIIEEGRWYGGTVRPVENK